MKLVLASMLLASVVGHESIRGRKLKGPPDCTLHGVALLEIPGENLEEDFVYECEDSRGQFSRLVVNKEQKGALDAMVAKGAVKLGEDKIDTTGAIASGNNVLLPNGKIQVTKGKRAATGRKLGTLDKVGKKPILVVRVIDDQGLQRVESPAEISIDVFGPEDPNVNLKSQLYDCSFGQLEVTKDYSIDLGFTEDQLTSIGNFVTNGVMEATIPINITDNDRYAIHNSVTNVVNGLLGFNLPGPFDQVMYVVEKCYVGCGYAAYAYINSWMSVYQDWYYKATGVQVHEFGHNFGMAHSGGLDGQTYTDHTCMMGNPLYSDQVGKMCFNGAKNWYLPWYGGEGDTSPYKIAFDPLQLNTATFTLEGIGEFDKNDEGHPVVVKLETGTENDYFIAFNRAAGPNAQNDEADNEVTITMTGKDGNAYSQSYLQAHLIQGQSHIFENFASSGRALTITAQTIDISSTPGTAVVTYTLESDCTVDSDCVDGLQCIYGSCIGSYTGPFSVELTTDLFPSETSWNIKRTSDNTVMLQSPQYTTPNTVQTPVSASLQPGAYTFSIFDSYGDGICCVYDNGSYKLKSNSDIIIEGGNYGSGESKAFFVVSSGPTPSPAIPPTNMPTPAPNSSLIVGETGRTYLSNTIDAGINNAVNIGFRNQYNEPVVVAFINTRQGGESVSARIRNVSSSGFQLFMQEPDNEGHAGEWVSYIVVESGRHTLEGGIVVEADVASTTIVHRGGQSFTGHPIQFNEAFSDTPAILHSLMTHTNNDFMASLVTAVTTDSFKVAMEAAETNNDSSGEDVGWIAFSSATGSTGSTSFTIGTANDGTNDGVTDSPHVIGLSAANFNEKPDIVVSLYGVNGSDGSWARGAGVWSKDAQNAYAEEDQISNSERSHTDEQFAWAAFTPYTDLKKTA